MRRRILAAPISVKALNPFDLDRFSVKINCMKPSKVRLFIKPFCGWCHEAMDWLEERGISFETLDVASDRAARNEMFELTGQTLAPVIDVDGEILADFDTDQLEDFWKKLESSPA
jgi:glutaredoxin